MIVEVVIVCFNCPEVQLNAAVDSVFRSVLPVDIVCRVTLVDNASDRPVALMDVARRAEVSVVRLDSNVGFGSAVNVGISGSKADAILLLNPDAQLEVDAVAAFVRSSLAVPAAILVGYLESKGAIQVDAYLLWRFSCSRLVRRRRYRRYLLDECSKGRVRVEKACGAALFARLENLRRFGPFDERFFLYFEDADLSVRASKMGVEVFLVPDARVFHLGAASQERFSSLVERARVDGAVRFAAYHSHVSLSFLQRLELGAVTLLGVLWGGASSRNRVVRLARFRELWRWGFRRDCSKFSPES